MQLAAVLLVATTLAADDSIDSILAEEWKSKGITPAELCTDDEFLRRASLDLIGRIPTRDELIAFRKQPNRAAKIDELLASENFPQSWSEVWTATFNGYTNAFESDREVLRAWLESAFRDNRPYDEIATELIAAEGVSALDGPVNFYVRHPEEPAVAVTRLFLGVRLDCARCHDHPFDRWKEEDFRRMNAFFEGTELQEVSEGNIRVFDRRMEAGRDDRPRFLTGARPRTTQWRSELALFTTNSKPFGRAFANRMWYYFFGRGVVNPVDDFNRENPPASPRLMAFLLDQVRGNDYDFRKTIRLICNSRAYQLSSRAAERTPESEALFAYRRLKPLTPEQTFDSAVLALGMERQAEERREFIERTVGRSIDEDFSETWAYRETVQGLMSRLNLTVPAPTESIGAMYERILSRVPTDRERELCRGQAPRDIAFALVNSNEFFFNH